VHDQDRNKQGKDFLRDVYIFLLFDLFVWFEKIEPESLQIFNHILIVTFSEWFHKSFYHFKRFFLNIFSSIQLFFHFLVLGVCVNTANHRNCELYLVYHDSRLCNVSY